MVNRSGPGKWKRLYYLNRNYRMIRKIWVNVKQPGGEFSIVGFKYHGFLSGISVIIPAKLQIGGFFILAIQPGEVPGHISPF